MILRPLLAATALLSAATARAQAPVCIPQPEAEALFLALAPAMLTSVAGTCGPTLPAGAMLRRPIGQLTAKYAAESDAAWPRAKEGLRKLLGEQGGRVVDSELARPMVTSMIAPMLAKEVKARDCPNIDRVLKLIDPLPAQNTAALVVALMDMTGAARARPGRRVDFILCPREARP